MNTGFRPGWQATEPRTATVNQATEHEEGLDHWLDLLRSYDTRGRVTGAQALALFGAPAVDPLCAALSDREEDVRVAAADSLGRIGDDRAVQPLMAALKHCFVGGSARRQLAIGLLVLLGLLLFAGVYFYGVVALRVGVPFWVFFWIARGRFRDGKATGLFSYFQQRRGQGRLCRAITTALEQIAERNPSPELRKAIPELQAVAADSLQHERQTREVSRRAASRIERLTEQLKTLPVSAAAPEAGLASLPAPASAPPGDVEHLPRI